MKNRKILLLQNIIRNLIKFILSV